MSKPSIEKTSRQNAVLAIEAKPSFVSAIISTTPIDPNNEVIVKVKLVNSGVSDAHDIIFHAAPPQECEFDPCSIGVLGSTNINFDILSTKEPGKWRIKVSDLPSENWAEFEFCAKRPQLT